MKAMGDLSWLQANQRYLAWHIEIVRQILESRVDEDIAQLQLPMPVMEGSSPAALDEVCRWFALSAFERDILLLCAGIELDSRIAALCGVAQGDPQLIYPTFSLALSVFPGAYWAALAPEAPLRRWRLIEIESGRTLTSSPLRIDERILHALNGVDYLDSRLAGLVRPLVAASELPPSHRAVVDELAAEAASSPDNVLWLSGFETDSKRSIAQAAAERLGRSLCLFLVEAIPADLNELIGLSQRWEREVILGDRMLYLDADDVDESDIFRMNWIERWIEACSSPLIVASQARHPSGRRPITNFEVKKPTPEEQLDLWKKLMGEPARDLDRQLRSLVGAFSLGSGAIQTVKTLVMRQLGVEGQEATPERLGQLLWDSCKAQNRPRLVDLAQFVEPVATWEDLVLPPLQIELLREIAMTVRQRACVYTDWGFAGKGKRGLGISALFTGESGVGKTMAAEVLARELNLDLYRIDLSAVMSKYIGETEKNLRSLFDVADESGAILLFDEADALFGKRSEVKDSHDRYANIEVSYLLQRMEAYRGLAILTTNLKDTVDRAFLRRIRFVVQFPFPDPSQRVEIWQRIFPNATPTEDLDLTRLGQLNLPGGNIRNIALSAAFLAADAGEPVRMAHLLRAARHEYIKLEKPLVSSETKGWDEPES
jgi:hypothetical protein